MKVLKDAIYYVWLTSSCRLRLTFEDPLREPLSTARAHLAPLSLPRTKWTFHICTPSSSSSFLLHSSSSSKGLLRTFFLELASGPFLLRPFNTSTGATWRGRLTMGGKDPPAPWCPSKLRFLSIPALVHLPPIISRRFWLFHLMIPWPSLLLCWRTKRPQGEMREKERITREKTSERG